RLAHSLIAAAGSERVVDRARCETAERRDARSACIDQRKARIVKLAACSVKRPARIDKPKVRIAKLPAYTDKPKECIVKLPACSDTLPVCSDILPVCNDILPVRSVCRPVRNGNRRCADQSWSQHLQENSRRRPWRTGP